MKTARADCGMLYGVRRGGAAVACCSLSVKCGTRDEHGFHSGIAHFTEHTLFKGTTNHNSTYINSRLEKLGGELNAYTTKEEIVLHATVLKEDLPKAISLLLELASQSTFPDKEVETEKGVVIDEIAQYKDSPADDVYDRFEEMFYSGHPLGGRILGTSTSVRGISAAELRRFREQMFIPQNMALTVVSSLPEAKTEEMILKLLTKYYPAAAPAIEASPARTPAPINIFDKTIDKHNHEANAVIGGEAPSLYDERGRLTAVLLGNILGGPASNSLLNAELREKNGWVYSSECSYTQYADSGIMTITLGCDSCNLDKCFAAIDKILDKLRSTPLSEPKLKASKRQLLGQLAISSDNVEAQCLSMGKSLLAFGRIASDEESRKAVMSITAGEIQAMAERIFNPQRTSRLIYL